MGGSIIDFLGKNKLLVIFCLLLFLNVANATNFGTERDINVFIDENEFGYTFNAEANEFFYLKVRIIDENNVALENYHIDLKVEDVRGVLVADYSQRLENNIRFRILSDANGFINFSFKLNTCHALAQDFCYQIGELYTFRIIQKNLDRRENFRIIPQTLEHNWLGETLRWFSINSDYLFIVGMLLVFILGLGGTLYWLLRGKSKGR